MASLAVRTVPRRDIGIATDPRWATTAVHGGVDGAALQTFGQFKTATYPELRTEF